jgi:hypothetical protein
VIAQACWRVAAFERHPFWGWQVDTEFGVPVESLDEVVGGEGSPALTIGVLPHMKGLIRGS